MSARKLYAAVAVSVLAHAGALFFVAARVPLGVEPPRLLEARLAPESAARPVPSRASPSGAPSVAAPRHTLPTALQSPPRASHAAVAAPPERLLAAVPGDEPAVAAGGALAAAPPAAPHVVASGGGGVEPVTAPSFGARYLDNPAPTYPAMARRRGLEGTVRLDVRVARDGRPLSVRVSESAGYEALDEAAMAAVSQWRFVPAQRGGEAVEASVIVPVRFHLRREDAG